MQSQPPTSRFLTWLLWGICGAALMGWVAAKLTLAGVSPLGILPLCVGGALGAILAWLGAKFGVAARRRMMAGTLLLAIVAILAEHAWLYLDFRRQWHAARASDPRVAIFRSKEPWSPAEYFGQELSPRSGALWAVDAVLVVAGAVGAVVIAARYHHRFGPCDDARTQTPNPEP